jgi:hypothetical protein
MGGKKPLGKAIFSGQFSLEITMNCPAHNRSGRHLSVRKIGRGRNSRTGSFTARDARVSASLDNGPMCKADAVEHCPVRWLRGQRAGPATIIIERLCGRRVWASNFA